MRKLFGFLFTAALLLSPQISLFNARADATARARGVIRDVDLAAHTVAIHTRSDETLVLKVTETTDIIRNGEPARLDDLQTGDKVVASYDPSTLLAASIDARGPNADVLVRIEGVISAVDTAARTVTIVPKLAGADGEPVTLNVAPNTEITLDGRPARLDDLSRGFSAGATFNRSTHDAVRISAEGLAEVRGTIRDVGVAAHTLTIAPSDGGPAVTLIVGPAANVSLNGRPATLDDLGRGFKVTASYVALTLDAVRVAAESLGEVVGHIREVDLDTAMVVIAPLVDGPSVELQVVHETVITIGGEPAPLNRLQPGMPVHAVFNIISLEAALIEARPIEGDPCTELRIRGTIAAISLHSSTITIDRGDPSLGRVTLIVIDRTEITINGSPARLSDLREGMRVAAVFCRESLVAKSIAAKAR